MGNKEEYLMLKYTGGIGTFLVALTSSPDVPSACEQLYPSLVSIKQNCNRRTPDT
jgi:hypothetical protein